MSMAIGYTYGGDGDLHNWPVVAIKSQNIRRSRACLLTSPFILNVVCLNGKRCRS